METDSKLEARRNQWLDTAKQLALACFERNTRRTQLCPRVICADDEKAPKLRELALVKERIAGLCQQLREIEEDGEPMGVRALMPDEPSQAIRVALVVLTAKNLSESVDLEINEVANVVEWAANEEPAPSLEVRQAFRADGSLRPYVHVIPEATLDQYAIVMTEKAFSSVLALPHDPETEAYVSLPDYPRTRRLR